MPDGQVARLSYCLRFLSLRAVSRQANIPYTTLWRLKQGQTRLTGDYAKRLRNIYQRTVYHHLRDLGFPAHSARRWSWYSPERVLEVEARFNLLVEELTTGVYASRVEKLEREGQPYSDVKVWKESEEAILEGLSQSDLDIEDWEKYLE